MGGRRQGTRSAEPVCSRPAGTGRTWGDGVELSILKAESALDRRAHERVGGRISCSWRAVGIGGRAVVVAAVALCVVVTTMWVTESLAAVSMGVSLVVLVFAALVDVVEHRLPNVLVAIAVVPVGLALLAAGSADLARSAAVGAAVIGGPLFITHLVTPAGMGFGDVKAGAVLGAAVGVVDTQVALLALVLGLAGAAAWGLARGARSIALGPGLVGGALAALLAETAMPW